MRKVWGRDTHIKKARSATKIISHMKKARSATKNFSLIKRVQSVTKNLLSATKIILKPKSAGAIKTPAFFDLDY
jgi:hypothetical protein